MNLPKRCTGCMACYSTCKKNAIQISQNTKGFYIPLIDDSLCVGCHQCEHVCPELSEISKSKWEKCYAGWTKNDSVREKSSSGGLFFEMASVIISIGGIVYGVSIDDRNLIKHERFVNINDIKKSQGSKYVQSYVGNIFIDVEKDLIQGKFVLFSGVACQIAGLKKYLRKEYENLITIDVLCHGAPSPRVFNDYLQDNKLTKIDNINFRYKKPSWNVFSMRIDLKDNRVYEKNTCVDPYLRLFLTDLITNDVCDTCKYVGEERVSDITLADFWGYVSETRQLRNDEKGISLILINSEKGNNLIKKLPNVKLFEKNFIEAKNGNKCLTSAFKKNKLYTDFWLDYEKEGYNYCINKYYTEQYTSSKRKLSFFINDHAYLLPRFIRNKLFSEKYKRRGLINE
ncbi:MULTISPECIES: Coenzyme F420 hydrogenase/dehydrogenase, beta subunit C-terminal domain [Bacillota]|jgi:coenzyme F420-reducing hydrogenase beta subunit|uniref:Coenzyme F420 hydrogenase/dehydrogenase, beta subunit C-terminal domain n=3 Tax=Erysipelotrichaceae TaxID=128827 RepID=A0ABS9RD97_9FIRM|nr:MULTISPECIES: Coenzyme F420 hydrogenase/dehydrogenase, beta subunit C-terminal domain [Bacillota]MCH4287615.1 Coenzyme F420 hydrogenase/dehydrogenase, beta subunit C-terminal domain [Amedibacillus hominis]RGB48682.1 4Fe-4S dicluster domain-containing protein [Absiella sp. AM22-9]RGB55931.1 4Fe-4S dicluster domain-containing protein [Absiella sp. AM10-20]RGB64021.1 4Fe-4S dicluster domain-containing protein [Absiella sp. AM09-45]RGB75992.1 4Fe-4S dicluster domain-containing protein [Absiella